MALTPEKLAVLREQASALMPGTESMKALLKQLELANLIPELVAEIDRLRAEIAAMRPIVEAVADYAKLKRYADLCEWCGAQGESANSHAAECPVTAATTFLAEHPTAGEASHVWHMTGSNAPWEDEAQ